MAPPLDRWLWYSVRLPLARPLPGHPVPLPPLLTGLPYVAAPLHTPGRHLATPQPASNIPVILPGPAF